MGSARRLTIRPGTFMRLAKKGVSKVVPVTFICI